MLNRLENRNALSRSFTTHLLDHLENIKPTLQVLLFRSSLPSVFCAGADLKERLLMDDQEIRSFVSVLRSMMSQISSIPCPSIACLDGTALGGGLELALSCDFRCGGPNSVVGFPETRLGITPGAGGTQRLPRLVGLQKAKYLIFSGRRLKAEEAREFGVIDFTENSREVDFLLQDSQQTQKTGTPNPYKQSTINVQSTSHFTIPSRIVTRATQLFPDLFASPLTSSSTTTTTTTTTTDKPLLSFPLTANQTPMNADPHEIGFGLGLLLTASLLKARPVALAAAKSAIHDGMQTDLMSGMEVERLTYEKTLMTHDRIEALKAFSEKRSPTFIGK